MGLITTVRARKIYDARGNGTVEVDLILDDGSVGRGSVPAGASTGSHEAKRVDNIDQAVTNAQTLGQSLIGQDPSIQEKIDIILLEADGSPDKSNLGANAILPLSLAACDAAAKSQHIPLYQHIHQTAKLSSPMRLPTPMFNVINGGKHSDNNLQIQEFMLVPTEQEQTFAQKMALGTEIFHALKKVLHQMGHTTSVGDEGGFAPRLNSNEEALQVLVQTIQQTRYQPGRDVTLAMDVAASSIPDLNAVTYPLDAFGYYQRLIDTYPISSIEDPLPEDDWQGWSKLTAAIGNRVYIVGDDLYTTNPDRLKTGIERAASNAIIVKPDQIGTLTETYQTLRLAEQNRLITMISHRSGETESSFIADLAVGVGAAFIKTGAPSRGERVAKYNQLLRIEAELQPTVS
ncbi:phosphopyruvate hydratase [Candidatus Berkelbacteria bacterium]|nr:phosphopyruvate hydratase [Candidatus Berkelbacteria bacterium]